MLVDWVGGRWLLCDQGHLVSCAIDGTKGADDRKSELLIEGCSDGDVAAGWCASYTRFDESSMI